jgi:hypothetical protein
MTNYYKIAEHDLYWKVIQETTTVLQIKNSAAAMGISKTTGIERYNSLLTNVTTWVAIDETEFNGVMTEVLTAINN